MKLTKILLSLFILAMAVACGDDDDAAPVDRNELNLTNLVGTYNVVAIAANATEADIDANGNLTDVVTTEITGSEFNNATITFTEQGVVTSTGTFKTTAIYTEDGFVETEIFTEPVGITGGFTLIGNNLNIPSLEVDIATVENFSESGFTLSFSEEDLGTDYSYILNGSFVFVRQ
jgi:hypothetical protein